nr:hypothetical protein [Acholeplasmatales bacterium]
MKKLKKISGALLLGAIALGVTACGAKSTNSEAASNAASSEAATSSAATSSTASSKATSSSTATSKAASSSVATSKAASSAQTSSAAASSSKAASSAAANSAAASSVASSSAASSSASPIDGTEKDEQGITIVDQVAYTEGAYVTFNCASGDSASDYTVSYTMDGTSYTTVDSQLVRLSDTTGRVDILGLKAGTYLVKIQKGNNLATTGALVVTADDRSGYAHFNNTTGVGAYNNDGTLKDGAIVVYVSDATKNTVTATIEGTEYTGISNILQAAQYSTKPIAVRLLDEVQAQQWTYKTHGTGSTAARMESLDSAFSAVDWETTSASQMASNNYYKIGEADILSYGINTLSTTGTKYDADGNATTVTGITHLDGLTNVINKCKSKQSSGYYEYDSYYNELDVRYANNITVEGVGDSAGIFQWGFCFNQCNSIEVKNLEFSSYNEDAIGIQGGSATNMNYHNFWIHNCTFNAGVNNWDVCYENDKTDGDGSTDFKFAYDLTISYCRYNKTHKTALIGSSSSSYQYDVTFHHNYYYKC